MKQKIAIKYLSSLVVEPVDGSVPSNQSLAFAANMLALGFMPSESLVDKLELLDAESLASLYNEVIPVLKEMVGAHRVHKPFYPNFPKQVMEMDEAELFHNALAHYWTQGRWQPDFEVADRPVEFESVKFKTLGVATEADLDGVFTSILSSADSIDGESKVVVEWFVDSGRDLTVPENIPFKENVCLMAALLLERDRWDPSVVKDTTDVLRIATHLSGGDISLAEPTKFKNQPRKVRRALTMALEGVARQEDFLRHKEKWIKLLHNLHVGDYSSELYGVVRALREHGKIETFNGRVEVAIEGKRWDEVIRLLSSRPGIYARMLGRVLTVTNGASRNKVANNFMRVIDDVPTRNLLQLWGSMKTRTEDVDKRVVFPKGSVSKARVLRNTLARLPANVVEKVIEAITDTLAARFGKLDDLGKVWIDPRLDHCPLPTGMRSASEGLRQVARGTRLPIGDKDTLRFFVYWKGQDIDLSATFHDEDFNLVERVAFYNLRSSTLKAVHSGDVTHAPNGATEFVDIDIPSVAEHNSKIRYVSMQVYVYSGPTFAEHEECFAGWMTRSKPNSNELFEPKTVEQKVDLRGPGKNVMPVMFDLQTREAVWVDMATNADRFNTGTWGRSGNTVDANRATIEDMVEAFVSLDNKITLGELFKLHGLARGTVVEDRDEADIVFGMDDTADVSPYNVTDINARYVV